MDEKSCNIFIFAQFFFKNMFASVSLIGGSIFLNFITIFS